MNPGGIIHLFWPGSSSPEHQKSRFKAFFWTGGYHSILCAVNDFLSVKNHDLSHYRLQGRWSLKVWLQTRFWGSEEKKLGAIISLGGIGFEKFPARLTFWRRSFVIQIPKVEVDLKIGKYLPRSNKSKFTKTCFKNVLYLKLRKPVPISNFLCVELCRNSTWFTNEFYKFLHWMVQQWLLLAV